MASEDARLVLVTPVEFDPAGFAPVLARALEAARSAAVILDLASDDEDVWRRAVEILRPVVQERGTALLLRDRPGLARDLGADGAHVTQGSAAIDAACTMLHPDMIVGAGDCTTRHAAMVLGEHEPDYVLLGRLDPEGDISATFNLVEWWSEIFRLPCVALCAEDWDSVAVAAGAGADFVALRDLVWNDPAGAGEAVRRAAAIFARQHEEAA